jgi:hypothetical protein
MRANTHTIGFLLFAVAAISTFSVPASAQLRSTAPIPSIRRPPVPGVGTAIQVTRACNRPLERRGGMMRAFIQSYDSTSGVLTVSTLGIAGAPSFPQPVFQTSTCLPIESHDGRRQTISALVPEKFIVIWVSDLVMPTQPPQFILMGIEVFDTVPTGR